MARALLAMVLASGAAAQPEVTWERVGNHPHNTPYPPSFGPDGALWGVFADRNSLDGEEVVYDGIYRLPPPYDSSAVWVKVSDQPRGAVGAIHALGRDTLIIDELGGAYRSVDAGQSWTRHESIGRTLRIVEIPAGLPYAGRLVAMQGSGMAHLSDDRGASWREATGWLYDAYGNDAHAERVAVVTTGPHAGRLLGAGLSGVTRSDDGGDTWHPTPEYAYAQQATGCIATLRGRAPGGGDRVVTVVNDIRVPTDSVYARVSDDGGDTWRQTAELWPYGAFGTCVDLVDLGGGQAAAVMMRGPVWWTGDAGETWSLWAEWEELFPPEEHGPEVGNPRAQWAQAGPDGRLYVGVSSRGPVWDKRTSVPVVAVAGEPPPREASGARLRVSPNPASGAVRIALEVSTPEAATVTVYDARGREVHREASGARGDHAWEVDTRAWAAGVYTVRAEVGGEVLRARFTVAR
ncbi:T9SS type A sorting domain-containing protein [Rubricoccus marinus]|uniref:T9SS type A sorting domain-containing protein n=1 Tax=Rubricoccus marinus TaxID=716817 RepID=UPI00117A2A0B|nr:T9SS type A sorting domain-containing protein [Rubricoccus marinus]